MGLSLINVLGFSWSVHFAHITRYWKFFLSHYTQVLCQYRLYIAEHAYLAYLMIQRQLSHLNGRKLDHRQVYPTCIFYVWLRLVLYSEYVHSNDFIWLLFIACIILLYNYIHTEDWKLSANRGPVCTLENFPWYEKLCFAWAEILRCRCLPLIPRRGKHKSLLIW
jgi:hypothetical protein